MSFVKITKNEKNTRFREKVMELAGDNIMICYQCGECSGGCPEASVMDLLPNQVVHKIQLGDEKVLDANTFWICSSCLVCSARCPKGIDIAKVMEALREISLRSKKTYVELEALTKEQLEELPQIALISSFKKQTS
ncbi:MAG: 4Fe-4S dicluster domain-containing protein [Candidatus Heimdallarchaeota archaeon]|nr:4Fe-4S dicluster domain-containing protein [Candidatus Heimdallarchaeota archaeon]MBY8993443.1 4Fe-4S dicluster domain-containing protein [Candidatus Heimdallarchaeota archaeon]